MVNLNWLKCMILFGFGFSLFSSKVEGAFRVNYERNQFEMNGKPFQYVSGSFHYFRALPDVWAERLDTMKSAGLNAIDTYIEWSFHNPEENVYNFTGMADVVRFLQLAKDRGLYVILRPGPYICAERDNGGIPYWLFSKYPNIKLRTSDANYLAEVRRWYGVVMPLMQPFLHANGGPIIMVQVENEYGVSKICDRNYLNWLRDETDKYIQNKAVLFTVDIPNSVEEMRCGKIDGVFATTDFGIDRAHEMQEIWSLLRKIQPNGPLVNSEMYPGWLTHWQEQNQRRDANVVANTLKNILESGASVNIYMFFGGTNFGFTAGANDWGTGKYMADITSYDYDAVMTEAGDPNGLKYTKIKEVIERHFKLAVGAVPETKRKMTLPAVKLNAKIKLLSTDGRKYLGTNGLRSSPNPLSFEQLRQYSGLVLYEATLPKIEINPTLLTVNKVHDRAYVLIDDTLVGILSRENKIDSLPINAAQGQKLQIFVENQGRINFNVFDDFKGILGDVTVQRFDGTQQKVVNWTMTGFPLTSYEDDTHALIEESGFVDENEYSEEPDIYLREGPVLYAGEFSIAEDQRINDTYIDPSGWGKGILYINGFNLGRYWPLVGPQTTLYVPKGLLRHGENNIALVEFQQKRADLLLKFVDAPQLDN